ncbi:MAG TPA: hypothetical protein VHI13_05600 [Candidatus Kapabacteria bacterium]|nr:hypothetical protein [Candidatus Kapabacteria bacterium]
MNIEDLISQYIDGSLSPDAESELHHRLAVSPEARQLFRSHIVLRSVARDQRVLHVPTPELRSKLFERLEREEGMARIPVRATGGGAVVAAPVMPHAGEPGAISAQASDASAIGAAAVPRSLPSQTVERRRRRALLPWLLPFVIAGVVIGVLWNRIGDGDNPPQAATAYQSGTRDKAPVSAGKGAAPGAEQRVTPEPTGSGSAGLHDASVAAGDTASDGRTTPMLGQGMHNGRGSTTRPSAAAHFHVSSGYERGSRPAGPAHDFAMASDDDSYRSAPSLAPSKVSLDSARFGGGGERSSRLDYKAKAEPARAVGHPVMAARLNPGSEGSGISREALADNSVHADTAMGYAALMAPQQPEIQSEVKPEVQSRAHVTSMGNVFSAPMGGSDFASNDRGTHAIAHEAPSTESDASRKRSESPRRSLAKGTIASAPPSAPESVPAADESANTVLKEESQHSPRLLSSDPAAPTQSTAEKNELASAKSSTTMPAAAAPPPPSGGSGSLETKDGVNRNTAIAMRDAASDATVNSVRINSQEEDAPLNPSPRPAVVYLIGLQQNSLINFNESAFGLQIALRGGVEFGDGAHQVFLLVGTASYREDRTDSVVAVNNGGVISVPSSPIVGHSVATRYNDYWAGVGYRFNGIRFGNYWSIGIGGWAGAGRRYLRVGSELPITVRIARSIRLEFVPTLQYVRTIQTSADVQTIDFDPSQPSSERHRVTTGLRSGSEIHAGVGLGATVSW